MKVLLFFCVGSRGYPSITHKLTYVSILIAIVPHAAASMPIASADAAMSTAGVSPNPLFLSDL